VRDRAPMETPDACRWTAPCAAAPAPADGRDDRRVALARAGETLAVRHLADVHGLATVATNLRVAVEDLRGELDVVMADPHGGLLVVCEVKTRTAGPGRGALDALGPAQRARIRRMTAVLLADGTLAARRVRFDLVTVDVAPRRDARDAARPAARPAVLRHVVDAW
jgi:putative endonuclease